jgi:hypothetical protein
VQQEARAAAASLFMPLACDYDHDMRKVCFALLLMAAALPAIPADPPADAPARIRIAGIFIAGFNVWAVTA